MKSSQTNARAFSLYEHSGQRMPSRRSLSFCRGHLAASCCQPSASFLFIFCFFQKRVHFFPDLHPQFPARLRLRPLPCQHWHPIQPHTGSCSRSPALPPTGQPRDTRNRPKGFRKTRKKQTRFSSKASDFKEPPQRTGSYENQIGSFQLNAREGENGRLQTILPCFFHPFVTISLLTVLVYRKITIFSRFYQKPLVYFLQIKAARFSLPRHSQPRCAPDCDPARTASCRFSASPFFNAVNY